MVRSKQIIWNVISGAGVVFSLSASIWFSLSTFIDPDFPYVSYPNDSLIALGYLLLFVFIGLLLIFQRYRWLGISVWMIAGVVILVALTTKYLALSILLLLWILWVSWCVGETLSLWISKPDAIPAGEGAVLNVVLGWGVLVVATFALGVVGLYPKWIFYGIFVIISLWGAWRYWPRWTQWRPKIVPNSWIGALGLSLILIIAIGSFFWALAPAVRYDSVSYHLAVPVKFLEAGRMLELPESFQTYFAHYGEMLYVIAFALGDQPLPGLINFTAGILLVIQTYYLGVRIGNKLVGWIAAVLLFSLPIIGIESATTYIDIFLALFVTSAFQVALLWKESDDNRWLLVVGIFSGLALGTKLNALLILIPFWGLILVTFYRENKRVEKSTLLIIFPALLLGLPWLIRDWLWTGNPIFPNLNSLFQSPEWFDRNFFVFQPTLNTLQRFLYFPWLGIADSHNYYHESPGGVLGALPLLSLPWFYGWHKERLRYLLIFVASLLAMAMLFGFGAHARYMMPLFPLLSILAALNVESLGSFLFDQRRILGISFIFLGLVYVFSTRLSFTVRWWEIPERYPFQIWRGEESQEAFVDRILPVYGAFEYLDQQGSFKVLSVGNELRLYTKSEIYGIFFSKDAYQTLHSAGTSDELAQNLFDGDYDYILVYPPEQEHRPEIYKTQALNQDFFERYTRLEYNQKGVELYRVAP
ncbi:MAG: glycosyltransferase family 39 protein [Anaerolineales bacterium]|nr:glycosyltransferase family 39 protein [Chloroflexota bacterium]MBL6979839.1 glycosyltransferase family 39 protein [Anaerolineales bacterium]